MEMLEIETKAGNVCSQQVRHYLWGEGQGAILVEDLLLHANSESAVVDRTEGMSVIECRLKG